MRRWGSRTPSVRKPGQTQRQRQKLVEIVIANIAIQGHWQILGFPFFANARCPTSLAILPVCKIPARLMLIYDIHKARIRFSGDKYVAGMEICMC